MDVEGFVRDGHVVIRRAFDADVAAACREVIWSVLESHGIDRADRGTWRAPKVDAACPPGGRSPPQRAARSSSAPSTP
ncbi:hypothetical protein ACFQHO_21330 [Actinomadura yumaensis]|uniref:hypothetical protein n=1 Tax=Actinomadura yumaensis TaxID=111807 RepID=UPI00361CFB76